MVADLWRYPVKSFGGERVRRAFVGPFGLLGDRRHAVIDTDTGEPLSARRVSQLLAFRARSLDPEAADQTQVECPDGERLGVDDPALAERVALEIGRDVQILRHPAGFVDIAPVHILSQSSVATMGASIGDELDPRRFRANLILELDSETPFAEADLVGRRLAVGGAASFEVVSPTERCAVTTYDPDTLERDPSVLATIARERENFFGVYAGVAAPGWISVGDPVHIAPTPTVP